MFCRQQVAELAAHEEDFARNNRHLVVIGSAEFSALPGFRRQTGYGGTLLTDPALAAFKFLELKSGISGMIGWQPLVQAVKALRAGFRPGAVRGDVMQLGGALVVDTGGNFLFPFPLLFFCYLLDSAFCICRQQGVHEESGWARISHRFR